MKTKINISSGKKFLMLIILLVIALIFQFQYFYTFYNIVNILLSVSVYSIMICGSIFPLLVGGMDLSVGAVAPFSAILCVQLMKSGGFTTQSVVFAIVVALLAGVGIGLINGIVTYYFNVPALLTTISTQYIFYGLAQHISDNQNISSNGSPIFDFIGTGTIARIPFPIIIALILTIIIYFLLSKTVFGSQVYAVGGNAKATAMMGISPARITIMAYVLSGFTSALAGIVLTSENTLVRATTGYGYELYVFIGLVIGGVNFAGGEGTIQGGIYGSIVVGVLTNLLNLFGVPSTYYQMIEGIVILIAVAINVRSNMSNNTNKRFKKLFAINKRPSAG